MSSRFGLRVGRVIADTTRLLDRAMQNAQLVPECKVFQLESGSRFEY